MSCLSLPRPPDRFNSQTAEELAEELFIYNSQEGPRKQYKTEEERQNLIGMYAKNIDDRRAMQARYDAVLRELIETLKHKDLFVEAGETPPASSTPSETTPARPEKKKIAKRREKVAEWAGEPAEKILEMLQNAGFDINSVATVNRDLKELGMVKPRKVIKK